MLERAEERHEPEAPPEPAGDATPGDWASETMPVEAADLARDLGTEVENTFDPDRSAPAADTTPKADGPGPVGGAMVWRRRRRRRRRGGRRPRSLCRLAGELFGVSDPAGDGGPARSRRPHDRRGADRRPRRGRLSPRRPRRTGAAASARRSNASSGCSQRCRRLEPTGVFARDLAECLKLQLIERDRFDPAMAALIANLPALAKRDFAFLRRVCGVDDEDLVDMIGEIKRLDPKPGRAFAGAPEPLAIPDVIVARGARRRLAHRTQRRGAAARAGQRDLRRRGQARRGARGGQAIYLDAVAERALADQEPGAARPHHPQRRLARSCAARTAS